MKKIGFVDYYLSEWHANHYPAWMAEACEQAGLSYKVAYAWAELDVSPVDGVTTEAWCEAYGAERCETLDELCRKSDVIVILAPSDPDRHLVYAETVLSYGKPTYIDKTFAPDLATAEKIFELAKIHGTPFFSTSALRYAEELGACENCRRITVTGGGSSVEEYIVHQAEMVVKKLGVGARQIRAEQIGGQIFFRVCYGDDRGAVMLFAPAMPYTAYMEGDNAKHRAMKSPFFAHLIADILRFFEEGTVSFDVAETLEVMKLREGAIRATEKPCEWVEL